MTGKYRIIKKCLISLLVLMLLLSFSGCFNSQTDSLPDTDKQVSQKFEEEPQENVVQSSHQKMKQEGQEKDDKASTGNGNFVAEDLKMDSKDLTKEDNHSRSEIENNDTEKVNTVFTKADVSKEVVSQTIQLWVTKDYGQDIVFSKAVPFKQGESIIDIIQRHVQVETAYGGSFVNGINGIISGYTEHKLWGKKKMDWFYYVNGVTGNIGSATYQPGQGDVIWWDYHEWGSSLFIPAIVGAYPEPFIHGYQRKTAGVKIITATGKEEWGQQVKSALRKQGVQNITLHSLSDDLIDHRTQPTIVVGCWDELSANLEKLNARAPKSGIFARFADEGLLILNEKGKTVAALPDSAGLVASTANGMGDSAPLWLVLGTDDAGLKQAIALLENDTSLNYFYGVVVNKDNTYSLPSEKRKE